MMFLLHSIQADQQAAQKHEAKNNINAVEELLKKKIKISLAIYAYDWV